MGSLWTIEELARRVAEALASTGTTQTKRQVSEAPTVRTIRYYADLGLLDAPSARHGLWAMYGERHLVQLLAIKRLQADGLSLDEVRARMAAAGPRQLQQLGRIDSRTFKGEGQRSLFHESTRVESLQDTSLPDRAGDGEESDDATSTSASESSPASAISPRQGIRLPGDIEVLFPATKPLTKTDLESLRVAAQPLLKVLVQRGLVPPGTQEPT